MQGKRKNIVQPNGTSETPSQDPTPSFEDALLQLTEVVEALEKGELSLEDALRFYEKGARLTRLCEQQLKDAEIRVTKWQDGAESEV